MKKWQNLLANNYRSIHDIQKKLGLSEEETAAIADIERRYPISVPEYYLSLIDKDNPADPIKKLCIPDPMEFSEGGVQDTSGEGENTVVQGMQHKYKKAALILSTDVCAMYCRHCFRKRMVGLDGEETAENLPQMIEYLSEHREINNVLVSGGDAFMNSNRIIERYLKALTEISHIEFIRFGTRTPVTFPFRITEDEGELTELLNRYSKKKAIIIVTHFNHPKELTAESVKAMTMLQAAGCIIRNQSVLLRGVNDDPKVLSDLLNGLVSHSVMPYYVFQCRPVEGVKNQFQVPFSKGVRITEEAKAMMSGPAKAFRYAMSHHTGKIEILGESEGRMLFKYHQAKDEKDNGRIFTRPLSETEAWFRNPF